MNPEMLKKLQVATLIIVFMSNSAAHKAEGDTTKQLFGEERPFLEDGNDLFRDDSLEDSLGLNKALDDHKPREKREYLPTEEDEEND